MSESTDDAIAALWDICDDGWFMRASSDQWWGVSASCPHGEWKAASDTLLTLWTAFDRIAMAAKAAHEPLAAAVPDDRTPKEKP